MVEINLPPAQCNAAKLLFLENASSLLRELEVAKLLLPSIRVFNTFSKESRRSTNQLDSKWLFLA